MGRAEADAACLRPRSCFGGAPPAGRRLGDRAAGLASDGDPARADHNGRARRTPHLTTQAWKFSRGITSCESTGEISRLFAALGARLPLPWPCGPSPDPPPRDRLPRDGFACASAVATLRMKTSNACSHWEVPGGVVGDLAVVGDEAGLELEVDLRLRQLRRVHVGEDAAQVLLTHGGADGAGRGADHRGGLQRERVLSIGAGRRGPDRGLLEGAGQALAHPRPAWRREAHAAGRRVLPGDRARERR